MAEVEKKRVTLHPLTENGEIDTSVNLYPKTLLDGIVNRDGEEVEVALKEDLNDFATKEEISECESKSNKVTSLSSSSTNTQYPSAKATYGYVEANKGTKLYKHSIILSFGGGRIYIVSTKKTAYTTLNIDDETMLSIRYTGIYGTVYTVFYLYTGNSLIDIRGFNINGEIVTVSLSKSFTDTVTPL